MSTILSRCVGAAAILALALGGVGCARSATPVRDGSKFVVLGSANATQGVVATPMPGLDANSIPRDAIKGIPGANEVAVASGTPIVSRERAIALSQPQTGHLVSAVYVLLPKKFMVAVLSNPKAAKPATAWIVTWTGVRDYPASGGAHRIGRGSTSNQPAFSIGDTSAVIDATTGTLLMLAEYATPHSTAGQGATDAGVNP